MNKLVLAAVAVWAMFTDHAAGREVCGAQVHTRFGETRAYFRDVLGACRSGGYCSAVVALADPSGETTALQQLRVVRASPGASYQVEVMATTPMPLEAPTPMIFQVGRTKFGFAATSDLRSLTLNEFQLVDQETTNAVVASLRAGRSMHWTYQAGDGAATAVFPLRGMTAALEWIDCMGRG